MISSITLIVPWQTTRLDLYVLNLCIERGGIMQNHRIRSQRRLRIESLEARRLLSPSPSNTTQSDPEPFDGSPASIASDTDVAPPRIVSRTSQFSSVG